MNRYGDINDPNNFPMALDVKTQQMDMIAAILADEGYSLMTAPEKLYRKASKAVCDYILWRPVVH